MAILTVNLSTTQYKDIEVSQKVNALVQQLKYHDTESYLHSMRVGELAYKFGQHLQLTSDEIMQLLNIGIIHDIGKLNVPRTIIKKEGPLDEQEWTIIKIMFFTGKNCYLTLWSRLN